MKLSSYKKKREVFEHEVTGDDGESASFSLLPMPNDLVQMCQVFVFSGGKELLSPAQRIRFISDCIVGWHGIYDDEGEAIEFSEKNKMQLAATEYDDLMVELILASYFHKNEAIEQLKEDAENAKK